MDIFKMLADLRAEQQQIEQAIVVIERLVARGGKRLGRPPKWMAARNKKAVVATAPHTKRAFSAAARKRMAAGQKRRWAATRAKARKSGNTHLN